MRQAIVSVEDQRFFEHNGIDSEGVAPRALAGRSPPGQSSRAARRSRSSSSRTRTSATSARSRGRCARRRSPGSSSSDGAKDRILTAYLNTIYFGNGAYGIQQAARAYFKKSAKELDARGGGAPRRNPGRPVAATTRPRTLASANARRRHVLADDARAGEDHARATSREREGCPSPQPEDIRLPGTRGPAPYFLNYVKDQLVDAVRRRQGVRRRPEGHDDDRPRPAAQGARRDREGSARNPDGPAAALVAIDPRTGAVKAMFGGRNFRESQFNLAAQAERQPGSAFKPIVLATAMREGISPLTELESKKVSIDAGDRIWTVTNYDHTYLGRVNLVAGARLLGQHGLRAADRPRRAEGDRQDGARPRHP